jgi:hypothetical protein
MVSEIRMEAPLRLAPQKRFIRREASQSGVNVIARSVSDEAIQGSMH